MNVVGVGSPEDSPREVWLGFADEHVPLVERDAGRVVLGQRDFVDFIQKVLPVADPVMILKVDP